MASDTALAESLARIEHKIDLTLKLVTLILNAGGGGQIFDHPAVGSQTHLCPVCGQNPRYDIDLVNAIVVRRCGCSTGKTVVDLKSLEPPVPQRRPSYGTGADIAAEDGSDSPGRGAARSQGNPSRR